MPIQLKGKIVRFRGIVEFLGKNLPKNYCITYLKYSLKFCFP
jgi:hypothetical protein